MDDVVTLFTRAATVGAQSWNEEARTLDVVFATGNPVERQDYKGTYLERLDMQQDWTPFIGAPVLDSHKRGALGDVLGSVIAAKTVGNEGRATIQISKRRKAAAIVDDIKAGHIRGVSVGYRVAEWKDSTEGGKRVRTATKWSPAELSIVAVGADPGASIRSQQMEAQTITTADPLIENRAAVNVEIRGIAKVAGLPQTWTDSQIDAGATIEAARAAAFAAMQARSAATDSIRTATAGISGHDANDPEWRIRTIGEAIHCRMSGTAPSEAARPYAELTLLEIAKDCLRARGLSTTGNPAQVMERSLISMSDLPALMSDAINRTLRQAYTAAPSGLKRIARQRTARDFRTMHRIQLSAAATLLPVNESGEFQSSPLADQEETYRLGTYGRIIGLTRQAFVNDDLGALNDLTRRMGVAAANFEAQFLVNVLQANAAMTDSHPVFDAAHGNLAATGTVISQQSLSDARAAMRRQTGLAGELIEVTPKFLVVPTNLETLAERQLTQIQAVQIENVNTFSFLSLVVEPRLTSQIAWYLVADTAAIEGMEYAYLEGEAGPQTFSEVGFARDGMSFKIREDFGAAIVEYRGLYKNPGA
jgi:HK97 family phage prohead protease